MRGVERRTVGPHAEGATVCLGPPTAGTSVQLPAVPVSHLGLVPHLAEGELLCSYARLEDREGPSALQGLQWSLSQSPSEPT